MAVSDGGIGMAGILVGDFGGLRRVAVFNIVLVDNAKLGLVLLAGPICQAEVSQSSQPLLRLAPGPDGFARVAVSTWPDDLLAQVLLSWSGPTPWPCVEQKCPGIHFDFTAA